MIASHPWLGITKPEWLIKSDTPHTRWPTGKHQAACPTDARRLHPPVRAGDNRLASPD
jgi:hypothetical protein